jgi:hypothetical protein
VPRASCGPGVASVFDRQRALARWNGRRWQLEPLPARFGRYSDGPAWQVTGVPAARSTADCVPRSLVPVRAGLLAWASASATSTPAMSGRGCGGWRWTGPALLRLGAREAVFLDIAWAGRAGAAWAAGDAGDVRIIASSGPAPR